jgi:hypothetical protein
MLRKQIVAAAIVLLITSAASGRALQNGLKGYEMYSWKVKGRWHYSILAGTNRAKNYDEITSSESARIGSEALKEELKKIPKGEEVFWRSAAHPGIRKPLAKGEPVLELPSRKRIKWIKAYCDRLGIKLKLM